jgi:ATP-dependent Lon protease
VANGTFHIYVVDTIDEGLEILTGKRAGTENGDGTFEAGSINDLVQARLREMARTLKEFGN